MQVASRTPIELPHPDLTRGRDIDMFEGLFPFRRALSRVVAESWTLMWRVAKMTLCEIAKLD